MNSIQCLKTEIKFLLSVSLLSLSALAALTQVTSSNLPLVYINTNGSEISEDTRITADMGIIYNGYGALNKPGDAYNNYSGKISIEIRGSSSNQFEKKNYRLSTVDYAGVDSNVVLIDMPEENDWILYAPYSDKTLMRNLITFELAGQLGHYQCRGRFC